MNSEEVESCVRKNITWTQLPPSAKQVYRTMNIFSFLLHNVKLTFRNILSQQLGNSTKEYDKCIVHYSLKNQLRYKGSLGKFFFFYKFFVIVFASKHPTCFKFLVVYIQFKEFEKMKVNIMKISWNLVGKAYFYFHTIYQTLSLRD